MGKVEIPPLFKLWILSEILKLFSLNQYSNPQLQLNGDGDGNLSIGVGSAQFKAGRNYE